MLEKIDGTWGFWEETATYFYGGYDTALEARIAMFEYGNAL